MMNLIYLIAFCASSLLTLIILELISDIGCKKGLTSKASSCKNNIKPIDGVGCEKEDRIYMEEMSRRPNTTTVIRNK